MPTVITGTDGINQVQTGAVESGDLPAGSVIQVVSAIDGGAVSTDSTSYVSAGLSASITPSSTLSTILITVHLVGCKKQFADNFLRARITRNGTAIHNFEQEGGFNNSTSILNFGGTGTTTIDSPSSISAQTYVVQIARSGSSGGQVSVSNFDGVSTITLMEIAG